MDMKKPVRNNVNKLRTGTTPADTDPPRVVCNDDKNIWFILRTIANVGLKVVPSKFLPYFFFDPPNLRADAARSSLGTEKKPMIAAASSVSFM